jgi:hypothetical protein
MTKIQSITTTEGTRYDDDLDGITVTELDGGVSGATNDSVFGNVLGVYEQHGYDAGYDRGAADVLLSLLAETESFIRRRGLRPEAAADLRRVVWALQEHLRSQSRRVDEFEDGLGI